MALFSRPEYQIGRGEVAESRVEVPFFVAFASFSAVALLIFHFYIQNLSLTIALAVSVVVFGLTFIRVEIGVVLLVFCMLLSPEIDAGRLGMGNRTLNLRYDDILIIVVFCGVLVKQGFEGHASLWRSSPINAGILAYYAVCVWSTLVALQRGVPLFEANKTATFFVMLKMAEYYMVFILVGSAVRSQRLMRWLLVFFFIVALIVSIYASYGRMSAIDRVSAPFEQGGTEPNTLGGYLVLVCCLSLALFTQAPSPKWRLLFLAVLVTAGLPLLFTLSRASYGAFVAGVFAVGFASRRYTLVVALALLLCMSPIVMPQDVQERVSNTFNAGGEPVKVGNVDTGIAVDKSTHERIYVWRKVRYNLKIWPWLGGGIGWGRILDSHYARVIIETGFIGLFAFLFLQWRILRTTWEAAHWPGDWVGRGVGLAAFACTIALIVHSFGTISFLIVRIMEPFWFLVGLAVVARGMAIEDYLQRRASREETGTGPEATEPVAIPAPAMTASREST